MLISTHLTNLSEHSYLNYFPNKLLTCPAVGLVSPVISLMVVLLPAPLCPNNPKTSPEKNNQSVIITIHGFNSCIENKIWIYALWKYLDYMIFILYHNLNCYPSLPRSKNNLFLLVGGRMSQIGFTKLPGIIIQIDTSTPVIQSTEWQWHKLRSSNISRSDFWHELPYPHLVLLETVDKHDKMNCLF